MRGTKTERTRRRRRTGGEQGAGEQHLIVEEMVGIIGLCKGDLGKKKKKKREREENKQNKEKQKTGPIPRLGNFRCARP